MRIKSVTLNLNYGEYNSRLRSKIDTQHVPLIEQHGGKRTREGAKSGIGRLERMKHGNGRKDRDDRSSGIEILMTDIHVFETVVTFVCHSGHVLMS